MPFNTSDLLRQVSQVYSDAELGQAGRRDIIAGLYQHGGDPATDFHYIGLLSEREGMFGTPNTFPQAMQALHHRLKLGGCPVSCQVQAGYVLLMSDDDWCIAGNDAWMLGGIHTGKKYVLMSLPLDSKDVALMLLCNTMLAPVGGRYPLTVTGREILGLIFYRYQAQLDEDKRLVFSTHDAYGVSATFSAYRQGIHLTEEKLRTTTERTKRLSIIQAEVAKLGL